MIRVGCAFCDSCFAAKKEKKKEKKRRTKERIRLVLFHFSPLDTEINEYFEENVALLLRIGMIKTVNKNSLEKKKQVQEQVKNRRKNPRRENSNNIYQDEEMLESRRQEKKKQKKVPKYLHESAPQRTSERLSRRPTKRFNFEDSEEQYY